MVYTTAAGVHPQHIIPIQVDVGCNTADVRDDPLYMGLQQVRALLSASKPTITNLSTDCSLHHSTLSTTLPICTAIAHSVSMTILTLLENADSKVTSVLLAR